MADMKAALTSPTRYMPAWSPIPEPGSRHPVLGITGPSGSGKSTLAKRLALDFGARVVCLDDYFCHKAERPVVNRYPSFERPHQYDGARMARDVAAQRLCCPVIAEGFLLFTYPDLLEACNVRIFVDISEDEILTRRKLRRDAGYGKPKRVERGFDAHGLEEWRSFGAIQAEVDGVIALDGTLSPDLLFEATREKADFHGAVPTSPLIF